MAVSRLRLTRISARLLLGGILAAVVYALTLTQPTPAPAANDGDGLILGYAVTRVSYVLAALNPTVIERVRLDLTAPAGGSAPATVVIRLRPEGPPAFCTNVGGATWQCATTGETVRAAVQLAVTAAQ